MAGKMVKENLTVKNLKIIKLDPEKIVFWLKDGSWQ